MLRDLQILKFKRVHMSKEKFEVVSHIFQNQNNIDNKGVKHPPKNIILFSIQMKIKQIKITSSIQDELQRAKYWLRKTKTNQFYLETLNLKQIEVIKKSKIMKMKTILQSAFEFQSHHQNLLYINLRPRRYKISWSNQLNLIK